MLLHLPVGPSSSGSPRQKLRRAFTRACSHGPRNARHPCCYPRELPNVHADRLEALFLDFLPRLVASECPRRTRTGTTAMRVANSVTLNAAVDPNPMAAMALSLTAACVAVLNMASHVSAGGGWLKAPLQRQDGTFPANGGAAASRVAGAGDPRVRRVQESAQEGGSRCSTRPRSRAAGGVRSGSPSTMPGATVISTSLSGFLAVQYDGQHSALGEWPLARYALLCRESTVPSTTGSRGWYVNPHVGHRRRSTILGALGAVAPVLHNPWQGGSRFAVALAGPGHRKPAKGCDAMVMQGLAADMVIRKHRLGTIGEHVPTSRLTISVSAKGQSSRARRKPTARILPRLFGRPRHRTKPSFSGEPN